eukprot:Protomagalhaensia_sp_Gyna_25__173@NODE_1083_length_2210_cov_5_830032_g861_i0_p1_GENE_NODE_1083_length_2210_cov_5_830032_g861_i0NODE_1083_length_2210_cov_5_830032_g861_i0_p1_ORF_typecomplete_len664_score82_66NAD_kinase/PF01513_21/1_9e73_NODE_1083_length_2210_cov_5_830032_g861_i011992
MDCHDDTCLFNRAQAISKSTYLVQGSQWSGSYVANHLRISPTHKFLPPGDNKRSSDAQIIQEALEGSAEPQTQSAKSDSEESRAIGGRSKIYLWECPLVAEPTAHVETHELPPRIEAFELPCYFSETPERVLIVKRTFTDEVTAIAVVLAAWLQQEWGITVYVEELAHKEMTSLGATDLEKWKGHKEFTPLNDAKGQRPAIDLVISLGGDGTTLWISTLFPDVVPPVFGVNLGSLSYLNQFKQDEILDKLTLILSCRPFKVQLRSRLFVALVDEEDNPKSSSHCVNECTIDRGPLSTMASIDVYVNDRLFTNLSADGLILATPTGSTAYSMSAGGPMVHPNVPCLLFTPISPHSLSMRPLILPDTATLRIRNPEDSRNNLWVSLDGRARREIDRGDSVLVSLSPFPFPLVCQISCDVGDAWLQALTDNLNWGMRVRQRGHDTEARCIERLTSRRVQDFPLPSALSEWFAATRESAAQAQCRTAASAPPNDLFAMEQPGAWVKRPDDDPMSLPASVPQPPECMANHSLNGSIATRTTAAGSIADVPPTMTKSSSQSFVNEQRMSWSQLFADRVRGPPPEHNRGRSLATEESSLDSQQRDESLQGRRRHPNVVHSRSTVSLHHSPFVQPIQKLRAAIAISPGPPRGANNTNHHRHASDANGTNSL